MFLDIHKRRDPDNPVRLDFSVDTAEWSAGGRWLAALIQAGELLVLDENGAQVTDLMTV